MAEEAREAPRGTGTVEVRKAKLAVGIPRIENGRYARQFFVLLSTLSLRA